MTQDRIDLFKQEISKAKGDKEALKKLKNSLKQEKKGYNRAEKHFGKHMYDFEDRCAFKYDMLGYKDLKNGNGEVVSVDMKNGGKSTYKVFSERAGSSLFSYTGQRNWKFIFIEPLKQLK